MVHEEERKPELLAARVRVDDPLEELPLEPLELGGAMDPRRGERRPEHRRLERAGEEERSCGVAHAAPGRLVGEHQRPAAGAEGFVQRERDHHALALGSTQVLEGMAPTVTAGPARAVGVVHEQMELLVAPEQEAERLDGREVPVHAVDAVEEKPHAAVSAAERREALLDVIEPAVPHQLHPDAHPLEQRHHLLDGHVHLVIQQHRVVLADERGKRGGRRKRRVGGDQREAAADGVELRLELGVGRRREEGARDRELRAEAPGGVDRAFDEARVELQAEVAARAEVQQPASVDGDRPAVEPFVLGLEQADAELAGDGADGVAGVEQVGVRGHGCPP